MKEIIDSLKVLLSGILIDSDLPLIMEATNDWANMLSDNLKNNNSVIYIDIPKTINYTSHIDGDQWYAGELYKNYNINILFCKQIDYADNDVTEDHVIILDKIESAVDTFITKLWNSTDLKVKNVNPATPVINLFDANLDVIMLELVFQKEINNICVPQV